MWHIWGKIKLKNSWRITPKKLTEKWGSIDRLFYANAKCHVFIRITSITFSWRQLNVSFMFLQIYNQRMLCNHPRACNWHSVGSYSRTQGTVFFFFQKKLLFINFGDTHRLYTIFYWKHLSEIFVFCWLLFSFLNLFLLNKTISSVLFPCLF